MRPDMILKEEMREVLAGARLVGSGSTAAFLFRSLGCPTLAEYQRTGELAGFSPGGNPRVFDGFLWVPAPVLRSADVIESELTGWFGCHDALDVMPSRLPVQFLIPSTHVSNVERGWNPLFTIAGRRSFPLGKHPMCCTLVDERTKKIFGVDCWKRKRAAAD